MGVADPQDQVLLLVQQPAPPKPFSIVKACDINRVAQRMLDETGRVLVSEVYQKCRPRIPGKSMRYGATLQRLVEKVRLKPRRKR